MLRTDQPLLEVRGLVKQFPGVRALKEVSIGFLPGEVHAVIGENGAGKSTLMHVLAGDVRPDSGKVLMDGQPTQISSPLASRRLGIRTVYQELSLCMNLTVAENIMLPQTSQQTSLRWRRRWAMRDSARAVLARLGMTSLDCDMPVKRLSVAQMQLVEIARVIAEKARLLVLDEPNSALSPHESEHLFQIVRQLRSEGVTILYVSHHLHEVLDLADRITIMRDGRVIETLPNANLTQDRLIGGMIGRSTQDLSVAPVRPAMVSVQAPAVLTVEKLASPPHIHDVSFELRRGEIVGIGGLPDSGKDDLAAALFGLCSRQGQVRMADQRLLPPHSTIAAIRCGMALVPADRRGGGALLRMSVADNVVSASLPRFGLLGFRRMAMVKREARAQVARLDARIAYLGQRLGTLSGGNQQKIIIGRALVTHPDVLLLHEPTRGIDVGAKAEIYAILRDIAQEGVGILMITSEMPELVQHCSRVLVMRGGRIVAEMTGQDINEQTILSSALTA